MSGAGKFVLNFYIQSDFFLAPETDGSRADETSSKGGSVQLAGGHTVTIENLTTLPYDVEIISNFPDPSDGAYFYIQGGTFDLWNATFKAVTLGKLGRTCSVAHAANKTPPARIHTILLRYKRPFEKANVEIAISPPLEVATEADENG